MKRTINRLTARQTETIKKPGRHADGGNLYLKITPDGSRQWVFMYALGGKQREMGLGSASKGGVLWTIPKGRTKAGKEHRVPLSDRCMVILKQLAKAKRGPFVFPGNGPRRSISKSTMVMLLRRMKVGNLTVHGFRSAARR